MNIRAISFAAIALLVLMAAPPRLDAAWMSYVDGEPVRKEFMRNVRTLFEQEDFAELERMANTFRAEKTRSAEGMPVLSDFYLGMETDALTAKKVEDEQGFVNMLAILRRWSQAYPGSITQRVAEANVLLSYAWFARGGGYANTVTDDGWDLFKERAGQARVLLEQGPGADGVDCPHRHMLLLLAGRAEGWDTRKYEAAFRKAVAFDPSYYPIYLEKTVNILPRWGGGDGEWQRFAVEATKLTPKEEGMTAYTYVLLGAQAYSEWTYFEEAGVSWPKMKQGYRDLERNFPNSEWNLNRFALHAVMANDKATVRELFERIGDRPVLAIWETRENYETCRRLSQAGKDMPWRYKGRPAQAQPGPVIRPLPALAKYITLLAGLVTVPGTVALVLLVGLIW
ncbi:MAG: DUF4034 domain-containing protein [Nitrospirae bacterium]|nr:DUF4034 domain-containing protein [Nitrospirota bacterium]